jgi:hypothetical protein
MAEIKKIDLANMSPMIPAMVAIFIVMLIILIVVMTKKSEGLKPWDTFDARFQQERDDAIGATQDGDSEREKQLRWQQAKAEALTGGFMEPEYEYRGEELPPKQESDIERTETSLEHSLHSN